MLNPTIIRRCARLLLPVLFIIMLISGKCHAQAMAAPDSFNREIFRVIRSGNAAQLDSLLQRGADANASGDGYSALMAAALNGNAAQMEMLINHGAVVNAVNADGLLRSGSVFLIMRKFLYC
jgi:hypothetical protein